MAATADEIDAALDHVANLAHVAVVAEITRKDVETDGLYAGFNGDVGTLHYVGPGTGSYSRSAKITKGIDSDIMSLSYDYQWNVMEFPPDSEVPIAEVRAA